MDVVLYSTGCPKCKVLTNKLNEKGIEFTENNSVEQMTTLGITQVPVLSVDGQLMQFADAVKWVNLQQNIKEFAHEHTNQNE